MNVKQQQAILLLTTGTTCTEVAKKLQVTPKTISTWKTCPEFRAELNSHMLDIKNANSERLRSLCMTALQTVEETMLDKDTPTKERLTAAFKLLELGQISPSSIGSTDADELEDEDRMKKKLLCLNSIC